MGSIHNKQCIHSTIYGKRRQNWVMSARSLISLESMHNRKSISFKSAVRTTFRLLTLLLVYETGICEEISGVFEIESTNTDIILYYKHGSTDSIKVHFDAEPRCPHSGQKWTNISTFPDKFRCAYGRNEPLLQTRVRSVTQQVARCDHPPPDMRGKFVGLPVTLEIDGVALSSTVEYQLPSQNYDPRNEKLLPGSNVTHKRRYLCACMTLWYRAEFLLEWVRYHSVIHGFEKLFVYDNDSDIDNLKNVVTMIQSIMNVSLTRWPHKVTQPAYMAHCLRQSQLECEWVAFFDVDEFVYAPNMTGTMSSYLHRLPHTTGGLEMQMNTLLPLNGSRYVKTPPGGVVRNYNCRWKATNIKSVVRPDTVRLSLYTGIHFFCYKQGYFKKTMRRGEVPCLYHYGVRNNCWYGCTQYPENTIPIVMQD